MTFTQFLLKSFTDDRGQPDGKLLTLFGSFGMLVIAAFCHMITAFIYGPERAVTLPEFMWGTFAGITLFGIGAGAYMFSQQAKTDQTRVIQQAKVEISNDPNCEPDPVLMEVEERNKKQYDEWLKPRNQPVYAEQKVNGNLI